MALVNDQNRIARYGHAMAGWYGEGSDGGGGGTWRREQ